jgi:hypothetical protein
MTKQFYDDVAGQYHLIFEDWDRRRILDFTSQSLLPRHHGGSLRSAAARIAVIARR